MVGAPDKVAGGLERVQEPDEAGIWTAGMGWDGRAGQQAAAAGKRQEEMAGVNGRGGRVKANSS